MCTLGLKLQNLYPKSDFKNQCLKQFFNLVKYDYRLNFFENNSNYNDDSFEYARHCKRHTKMPMIMKRLTHLNLF